MNKEPKVWMMMEGWTSIKVSELDALRTALAATNTAKEEAERFVLRDRDGRKVSQGAFNAMQDRYYLYGDRMQDAERQLCTARVDVVFDGPPSHESGRFVEVENSEGMSINFGEWVHRPDGYWALRFDAALSSSPCRHAAELTPPWKGGGKE